ncbi:MAG: hypothetical protein IK074_04780 [Bacteroidales bacterium]|nr:hypothetical protein [Bacteroidales bacterium]
MKKSIILAAILLLLGLQANAQIIGGFGYIYSSEKSLETATGKSSTTPFHGFYLGASYNIHLVAGLGVAPGLYASFMLHKENAAGGSSKIGYNINGYRREFALNVPVNFNYAIELGNDRSVFAYAGPVFQLGLTNTTSVSGSANVGGINVSDGESVNNFEKGYVNRFNIFLGGGLGLQLGDILIHVGYDHSLLDFDKDSNLVTSRGQLKVGVGIEF